MAKKKESGKGMLILLVLILLIVVVLFLLFYSDGLGNGFGTDSDNHNSGAEQSISDTLEHTEIHSETGELAVTESVSEILTETETELLIFDVTVMGSVYLYQNQEIILEDLLSDMQSQQVYFMVRITDDNATQNAMEDLLTALQDADITYAMN